MKYNNHLNYRKRQKFVFRVRLISTFVVVVAVVIGLTLYINYLRKNNQFKPVESGMSSSVMASSINILKSPFFQFQAPQGWVEIPNESTSNKFVYRSIKANLIVNELIIYVNQIPANLEANRILPVRMSGTEMSLDPTTVSDHCIKKLGDKSSVNAQDVIINDVRLRCDSDSTNYTVMVGLIGKDTAINIKRPDNTHATYTFYYTNLRAVPDASEFTEMVRSFQTR